MRKPDARTTASQSALVKPAPHRVCVGILLAAILLSSCTLLARSPQLIRETSMPLLPKGQKLIATSGGTIPYQRWKIPYWSENLRYVWMVGSHDFRKHDNVEIILYFHGMHSKDYFRAFRRELEALAKKRRRRPFLFVGFVDTPYVKGKMRGKHRWKAMVPEHGKRPERLFRTVNHVYKAFRKTFPHVKKRKTKIVLTGFSGGGRVLSSVGRWLAKSAKNDPYARVFRERLSKIVYFDCWFDAAVLETVPSILAANPRIKIIGTVHMKKPKMLAKKLAGKMKMRRRKNRSELTGLGGRLLIFRDKSHWKAMIERLKQALEV
ncbi:hypothetical protein ACFL2Q_03155 [Thermodesulfobacteriota bacterium]